MKKIFIGFCVALSIAVLGFLISTYLGILSETKFLIGWFSACGYIEFGGSYKKDSL